MKLMDTRRANVMEHQQAEAIVREAESWGGAEVAGVVVGAEHARRVIIATDAGLLVADDLPNEQHMGDWAFRSTHYRWADVRGVTTGRAVYESGGYKLHLDIAEPAVHAEETQGKHADALAELATVCLERAGDASS